jgi:hypothetical protein
MPIPGGTAYPDWTTSGTGSELATAGTDEGVSSIVTAPTGLLLDQAEDVSIKRSRPGTGRRVRTSRVW